MLAVRRMFDVVAEAKNKKLTVLVTENDMIRLNALAVLDDVAIAHIVRTLIRAAHAARFVDDESPKYEKWDVVEASLARGAKKRTKTKR